jgi:hypothetical protein
MMPSAHADRPSPTSAKSRHWRGWLKPEKPGACFSLEFIRLSSWKIASARTPAGRVRNSIRAHRRQSLGCYQGPSVSSFVEPAMTVFAWRLSTSNALVSSLNWPTAAKKSSVAAPVICPSGKSLLDCVCGVSSPLCKNILVFRNRKSVVYLSPSRPTQSRAVPGKITHR